MRSRLINLFVCFASLALGGGCGPRFCLRGTWRHPLPLKMEVGERFKAIGKGLNFLMPLGAGVLISSEDTNIVSLDFPDYYCAYITATHPGTASVILSHVYVRPRLPHRFFKESYEIETNASFEVRVVEKR